MVDALKRLGVRIPWLTPAVTGRFGEMLLKESNPFRLIGEQLLKKWD